MTNKVIAQVVKAGKQYKTGDTVVTALEPSTMDLKSGELTLIIGPSGSGKTTLLSLFGCIIYPTSGDVFIDGVKINDLSENKLAAIRLEKIGFIFQQFNLVAPLSSIQENHLICRQTAPLVENIMNLKTSFSQSYFTKLHYSGGQIQCSFTI